MNILVLAWLAVALLALAAAFQLGLAAGAPWGAAAYGGRVVTGDGDLPGAYRLGSGIAALMLLGTMWVLLAFVSVVGRGPVSVAALTVILWCFAAMFGLNTLGNARGRHPLERGALAPSRPFWPFSARSLPRADAVRCGRHSRTDRRAR